MYANGHHAKPQTIVNEKPRPSKVGQEYGYPHEVVDQISNSIVFHAQGRGSGTCRPDLRFT